MFEDDQQRTVAIGIWITSFSVGAAIGPLVGGVLLESFHWGSVFLLAVPVMALLLAIGPRLLPEYKDPEPGRLDLASAALSLVAVLAVIYGVKAIAKDGVGFASVAPCVAGLALGAAFVDRQRRLADPMIDLGLFRRPRVQPGAGREHPRLRGRVRASRSSSPSTSSWCSATRRSRPGCGACPAPPRSSSARS